MASESSCGLLAYHPSKRWIGVLPTKLPSMNRKCVSNLLLIDVAVATQLACESVVQVQYTLCIKQNTRIALCSDQNIN